MSKRHPLDQLFHDQLANSSATVPDNMWERIQDARQPKRRPPYGRWLLLGLVLLVSSGSVVYWLQSGADSTEIGQFPVEETMESTPSALNEASTQANESIAISDNLIALEEENIETENITLEGVADVATASIEDVVSENANTSNSTRSTAIGSRQRDSAPVAETSTIESQEIEVLSDEIAVREERLASETEEHVASIVNTPQEESTQKAAGPHQRRNFSGVAQQLPTRLYEPSIGESIKLFANHPPRCAKFDGSLFHVDAELLAGPSYAHSRLTAKTGESEAHLQQRLQSESPAISYTTTFRLAATTKTGLGLRSGLAYTQINDRFEHEVGSRMNVEVIFGPSGEVLGRDTTYTEGYVETSKNRLKFIEVPVLLGYEKQVGKLRVGVQAGAYLGLSFDAQGTTFSPATAEPIAFGQDGEPNVLPIFRKRATAAWYGGVTVAYNLASRYSIVAEPYFKTYPRVLSNSAYDLEQNYWMTGLQLGLRMRL